MTFPNAWDLSEDEGEALIEQTGGAIGGAIGVAIELTEKQKEVLEIIYQNPNIAYREIAIHLNINKSAVLKHIKALKKKGALTRIGGTRGYWQVG